MTGALYGGLVGYALLAYIEMVLSISMTVVETPSFLRDAKAALSNQETDDLVLYLAIHPDAGDIVPDTGGVRKLRWRAQGRGKRGGVRVIYYYHSESVPLFLLNVLRRMRRLT